MIKSFKNKGLELFATKGNTRKLPVQNANRVRDILTLLEAANRPADMNKPGYFWHSLGEMAPGRYSVRVSGNWRITFGWQGDDAIEVDIEDYH